MELRYLLNEWDPIGVASVVPDEYDCMLGGILQRLVHGADEVAMGEYVWRELEDHFGVDPLLHHADEFGASLAVWFRAKAAARGYAPDAPTTDGPTYCRSERVRSR